MFSNDSIAMILPDAWKRRRMLLNYDLNVSMDQSLHNGGGNLNVSMDQSYLTLTSQPHGNLNVSMDQSYLTLTSQPDRSLAILRDIQLNSGEVRTEGFDTTRLQYHVTERNFCYIYTFFHTGLKFDNFTKFFYK